MRCVAIASLAWCSIVRCAATHGDAPSLTAQGATLLGKLLLREEQEFQEQELKPHTDNALADSQLGAIARLINTSNCDASLM